MSNVFSGFAKLNRSLLGSVKPKVHVSERSIRLSAFGQTEYDIRSMAMNMNRAAKNDHAKGIKQLAVMSPLWLHERGFSHPSHKWCVVSILRASWFKDYHYDWTTVFIAPREFMSNRELFHSEFDPDQFDVEFVDDFGLYPDYYDPKFANLNRDDFYFSKWRSKSDKLQALKWMEEDEPAEWRTNEQTSCQPAYIIKGGQIENKSMARGNMANYQKNGCPPLSFESGKHLGYSTESNTHRLVDFVLIDNYRTRLLAMLSFENVKWWKVNDENYEDLGVTQNDIGKEIAMKQVVRHFVNQVFYVNHMDLDVISKMEHGKQMMKCPELQLRRATYA